jgi:hypothetical protein
MIKKHLILIISGIAGLFSTTAHAQYENIRFPQPAAEIALFQKNKVMGETQWSIEGDKKIPYYTRAFDPQGRQVISADYYHRIYYLYDERGYLSSFLDSFRTNTGFDVSEYKFRYYDNGMLMEMKGPGMNASFTYDPEKRILTEKLIKNDTAYTNIYKYDEQGKLKDAQYFDADRKPTVHTTKNYASDGRLYNESIMTAGKDFSDSTLTIYEYNDKNQLFRKQRFRYQTFYYSTKGSLQPDHSASHYDQGITNYELDAQGRPIAEEFTIKDDKLTYRYNTWQYDQKGLTIKQTLRIGKAEPKTIVHDYVYFDQ